MPRNRSEKASPPTVDTDGNKFWFREGRLHREGGPAIEYRSGTKQWWLNGSLIREERPSAT